MNTEVRIRIEIIIAVVLEGISSNLEVVHTGVNVEARFSGLRNIVHFGNVFPFRAGRSFRVPAIHRN